LLKFLLESSVRYEDSLSIFSLVLLRFFVKFSNVGFKLIKRLSTQIGRYIDDFICFSIISDNTELYIYLSQEGTKLSSFSLIELRLR
jgi:hypothetical protein